MDRKTNNSYFVTLQELVSIAGTVNKHPCWICGEKTLLCKSIEIKDGIATAWFHYNPRTWAYAVVTPDAVKPIDIYAEFDFTTFATPLDVEFVLNKLFEIWLKVTWKADAKSEYSQAAGGGIK